MPPALAPLPWLHVGAATAAAGFALACLLRPTKGSLHRGLDVAVALVAALALPLASAGGWWVDMPTDKMVPIVIALSGALALFGARNSLGRMPTLALAAFFLTLGMASLRNGGPLMGFLAVKSMLLGLMLALLPLKGAVRPRMALLLVALAAAAVLGAHRDIPMP
jgi:hypothetical protein